MRTLFFLALLTLMASCKSTHISGQYVEDNQIEEMHKELHKIKQDKVIELIGSPTIVPQYNPNTWYYISINFHQSPFTKPRVFNQRIVQLMFNENKTIEKINLLEDSNHTNISPSSDYTPTFGTTKTPLQHFMKNFGRFNKKRNKKR